MCQRWALEEQDLQTLWKPEQAQKVHMSWNCFICIIVLLWARKTEEDRQEFPNYPNMPKHACILVFFTGIQDFQMFWHFFDSQRVRSELCKIIMVVIMSWKHCRPSKYWRRWSLDMLNLPTQVARWFRKMSVLQFFSRKFIFYFIPVTEHRLVRLIMVVFTTYQPPLTKFWHKLWISVHGSRVFAW